MSERTYGHIVVFDKTCMVSSTARKPTTFTLSLKKAVRIRDTSISRHIKLHSDMPGNIRFKRLTNKNLYKIFKVYINVKGELVTELIPVL